jgi:hypothetical protein
MGPFKPSPLFPAFRSTLPTMGIKPYEPNRLAGTPPSPAPRVTLASILAEYGPRPKTQWVPGYLRRTGNPFNPFEWVPGHWRSEPI